MTVPIKNGRFLVIGGAGLIGSHLVDQLLESGAKQVRIYDNFSRGNKQNCSQALSDNRCEIFGDGGDILHRDILQRAMAGMDGVFHLAALWLLQCWEYPRSAFEVNIVGTLNVVEAAIACGVKRLVFSSSASVYGDPISEPIEEDHPFLCKEFYGASKVCGEMMIRAMHSHEQSKGKNFKYVGLRYMNVYGPRQDDKGAYTGVITRMLNALDSGEAPVIFGDGSQSYDFIDVRDCARANMLAMKASTTDRYYNIGTGIKVSINQLAEMLITLHPNKVPVKFESAGRSFVRNRVGSIHRASAEIGFRADISLEQGLSELIHWRHMQAIGGRI